MLQRSVSARAQAGAAAAVPDREALSIQTESSDSPEDLRCLRRVLPGERSQAAGLRDRMRSDFWQSDMATPAAAAMRSSAAAAPARVVALSSSCGIRVARRAPVDPAKVSFAVRSAASLLNAESRYARPFYDN